MRRLKKFEVNHNSEFDLDLAPLLAVMVKLVPVLLLSSAFVQMMVIESELPQVVTQAIQRQEKQEQPTNVALEINTAGFEIVVTKKGKNEVIRVPASAKGFDYTSLHTKLVEVKTQNPEVFKIEINPDGNVPYDDVVKAMDEARQVKQKDIRFPVFDTKQGKNVETDFMFPEVVFANMMEG